LELQLIKLGLDGKQIIEGDFAAEDSPNLISKQIQQRVQSITPQSSQRQSSFQHRSRIQRRNTSLPLFPTTTIGSFPQTADIRKLRKEYKNNQISEQKYFECLRNEIKTTIKIQEELNLDVLVHGEPERTDMVEYFAEHLNGFTLSEFGWVQSYGSRCVRPPILYSDVSRSASITVAWTQFAQSLTQKPVKGMLTGPVTLLQWSFVREDLPRKYVAKQLALAIRDEIGDLEKAGIKIIQVDEPALREGLPLRNNEQDVYLTWAIEAFKISTCGVLDTTQVHTHMCYAEFNDILQAISDLDADVITIETSRSNMELLNAFAQFNYPNQIGPGVYDIHNPSIPTVMEMVELISKAINHIPVERLWINPDCGLKTRRWEEVTPALRNMAVAAQVLRQRFEENQVKEI